MATPTPGQVGRTNPPLPAGTEVWIPSIGDTVIAGAEISPGGYVYYRCTGVKDLVSGMTVYRRRAIVPAPPADPVPPSMSAGRVAPGRDVAHAVHADASAPETTQHAEMRTPAFLRHRRERSRERVFGLDVSNHPTVTPPLFSRDHRFTDLARLIVNGYGVNEDGLSFQVTVLSNLEHVAVPHDLILVTLDGPGGRRLDTVIVLTPPPDQNVCTFSASYTWNQLAKLLGMRRPAGMPSREAVLEVLPQAGLTAEWWDNRYGRNEPRHYSGGMDQKNGSGRIDLRPLTPEDLKDSETVAKGGWHAGEPLRDHRPVYQAYKDVLQPGMEMATSLEAESEFLISGEQHVSVVSSLRALFTRPGELKALGVELMSAEHIRRCTDTYYDVPALSLLRCAVVLRRRQVNTDEAGSFHLHVKGRSVAKAYPPGERIRLLSRVHLREGADPERLGEFLADDRADNAFARVLADALGRHRGDLAEPKGWAGLGPRLVITAQRVRYSFELAHATTVDLCADSATGTDPLTGRSRTIHTVSFTLGHPGFFARDTVAPAPPHRSPAGPAIQVAHEIQVPAAVGTGLATGTPAVAEPPVPDRRVLVTRPYHVPTDLDDPALFNAPDYLQYQELRYRMLHYLFGYASKDLAPGGNKAQTLARLLEMI
ncbi:hypothetical protein [Actinomadura sp. 9N407]|uniref:hypothetical protein n=1 Tax=Actinomadura sp. 9N407 TaxID=3375154 RepID=UPI00378F8EA3